MAFQKKQSIFLVSAFVWIILALITVLACRQLDVAIQKGDVDYWTLQQTTVSAEKSYQIFYSARIQKIERKEELTHIWLTPKRPEVNLNTPVMTLFVKGMMHITHKSFINSSVWVVLSLLSAAVSVMGFLYWMHNGWYARYFSLFLLSAWLSWPSLYAIQQGQVSWFVLPVLVLGFMLHSLQYRKYAAITLGVLASLKLFFLIFVLLYVLRFEWRLLLLFFTAFLITFFLPLLYFSFHNYVQYFELLQNHTLIMNRTVAEMNGTILGFVANIMRRLPLLDPLKVTLSVSSLCIFYGVWRWICFDLKVIRTLPQFQNEIRFAFLIVLALLFSPLGWLYYFIFLMVPYAVISKVSCHYQVSKKVWIFLIAGLFLTFLCFIPLPKANSVLYFLKEIAVFFSLLCWLLSLRVVTYDVQNAMSSKRQSHYLIGFIPLCYALCSIIVFSGIPGGKYFWQWNKTDYQNTVAPTVVVT